MSRKGENIYRRKDGRWEARYIKGHRLDGRIHYGYCYGKTYHEARDKMNQARFALMNNQPQSVRGRRKHLSDYCDEWLCLKRSSVKPATFVKYTTILEKYIKPDLGEYFSEAVSEILVEQFSYHLLHEKNLSQKTVRDILSVLNSILDYTVKQNPLARSVEIVYPRAEQKEMRVLTVEEQKRFTEYLLKDMDVCRFGVLLALMTGLRIGDDDDKIRLNQRKPSKYKGLSRFGPEKNLQRINKFMKERPIFYKNLIQMKENFRFYLRCFYCITKVVILQFNSENRTELARNG